MFFSLPLLRSSTMRTLAPRSIRASTRLEPMNDAPPVTKTSQLFQVKFPRTKKELTVQSRSSASEFRFRETLRLARLCASLLSMGTQQPRRRTKAPAAYLWWEAESVPRATDAASRVIAGSTWSRSERPVIRSTRTLRIIRLTASTPPLLLRSRCSRCFHLNSEPFFELSWAVGPN